MKKRNTKGLRSEIVALITSYVNKGDYSIELKKYAYGDDNYCDGAVTIGGLRFGCSFHKLGYICWFDMGDMMRGIVELNKKLWKEVDELIAEHQADIKEERIKQLEKELKELKGE